MKTPSHTTLAAYGALFFSLAGSSYAATQIPRNSVGTPQIKNGAITQAKLVKATRPLTKAHFAAAVASTMTSSDVLTALSDAVRGDPGVQGSTGAPGSNGPVGSTGTAGSPGANGTDGAAGPKGGTGPNGVPGPQGTSVGSADVPANGTNPTLRYLTLATHTTVGTYCFTTDKGVLPNFTAAVASLNSGDATSGETIAVEQNPTGGACAGKDIAVTTAQTGTYTDLPFTLVVS